MRNLLALLAFVVLAFAGLGWYQGWYKVERTEAAEGRRAYNVEVNTNKISTDVKRGSEKLQQALESAKTDDSNKRAESSKPDLTRPAANQ
jgi:hypothetical protein